MAVAVEKVEKFMSFLWELTRRPLVMAQMITRVTDEAFKGAKDDTVTFRIPGLHTVARDYDFRGRTGPIVLDDIAGGAKIPIKLDRHSYSATAITDEQMTLDEIKFSQDVLRPQAEAVANKIENETAEAFYDLETDETIDFPEAADPYKIAIEATRIMSPLVPDTGRFWLMGSNVEARVMASDRVSKADSAGGAEAANALANARRGRLGGWNLVASPILDPNFSAFMHKSALVLATVAPVVPDGAAVGRRFTQDGIGMRWIQDYDSNYLRDRSVVSMFHGLQYVYDRRKGGTGVDRYDLKPWEVGETPSSFRAIKVIFAGDESVL